MDTDTKPDLLYLEKTTTQSLHDRFSEVLMEQMTQGKVLFKGRQKSMVLRLRNIPRSRIQARARIRTQGASVWTRIGWYHPWRRGVWNFMNKYHRRVYFRPAPRSSPAPSFRFSSTPSFRFSPSSWFNPAPSSRFMPPSKSCFNLTPKRVGLRGVRRRRRVLRRTPRTFKGAGLSAGLKQRRIQGSTQRLFRVKSVQSQLGVASMLQRRVLKKATPTKRQLDSELDQYMSLTRSRLDQQLDDYMSLSRSRLDAELDEYMALAGQDNKGVWG